jgi:putative ABC transport system permease protein
MKLRRFGDLSLRNLGGRPQRALLTTIGIVLGVGIVFGVLTLSSTMSSTFTNLYSKAYGAADIIVTAAGGSGAFDAKAVDKVRETNGIASIAPRLSLPASLLVEKKGDSPEVRGMRLFGVEPESAALATGFDLSDGRFPKSGAELTLDEGVAEEIGVGAGDSVTVATPKGPEKFEVVGTLRIPGGSFGGSAFGMAPLPFAQKAFDKPGKVSGIAVESVEDGAVAGLRKTLQSRLGDGFQVERSETRTAQVGSQLQGFQISLLFFAGTSLFVGAFLVFNALSMTVLERTRELGMLRALGATRAMIARSVVLEAAALGIIGSALGVLFGYGMAWGLVFLFGKAFLFEITSLVLSPFALLSALTVGIIVTVAAALYPALRAGRVSPVEAMRVRAGGGSGRSTKAVSWVGPMIGLALIGAGAPWILYLSRNLSTDLDGWIYASGIAGVVGTFLGVSLLIPALVTPLATLFAPILGLFFGVEGRMAAANATRNRNRTALTASAVMVGISLVVAFSALGDSVLGSISSYLEDSLGADYAIKPANEDSGVVFSDALKERIVKIPGVEETTGLASSVRRDGAETSFVFGIEQSYESIFRVNFVPGSSTPKDAFSKLRDGEALVGQQLAASRDLRVGSNLALSGLKGREKYRIAGIVDNDVLGGGAGVYVSRKTLSSDFGVTDDELLAIKAAPGAQRSRLTSDVRAVLKDYPQFTLLSNAEWKERIEQDFGRQYVFFYAIMGVSVAVAAFGVVNTLSMSVFERTQEIGVLRAIGATRFQVGRLVVDEGVVIGGIGCLIGVVVGSLLGYLFVRGTSASGFEVAFHYPTTAAILALSGGLFIGVFAGLLPARAAARKDIVEAVQYE